jgi:alcohol dehydrogenase class IV
MARIARALGTRDAPTGLYDLELRLGLKMKLADLGMPEADLERAARIASESPYPNPAPVTYDGLVKLLQAAYGGRRPA